MNVDLSAAPAAKRKALVRALTANVLTTAMVVSLSAEKALDDFILLKTQQVAKVLRKSLPKGVAPAAVLDQARQVVVAEVLEAVA